MSQDEFDNYLTLLTSLLQLKGEQREAMAEELRAHLEDRLDDLLARGYDRDAAVKLALEDFGDAAGLAANFSLLVRNRRRRWMMKVTSYSTAALVLIALGLFALWPENRPGPAPRQAIAQQAGPGNAPAEVVKPQANSNPVTAPISNPVTNPPSNSRSIPGTVVGGDNSLDEKLAKRITAEFVETPLHEVLSYLSDVAELQIFVNQRALQDEGITVDELISINLKSVRVDMLLDLILDQGTAGGATYVERDGILIVSTLANLEGASEVRVYNCRDLLAMESPKAEGPKAGGVVPGLEGGGAPGAVPGGVPSGAAPGLMGAGNNPFGAGMGMPIMGGGVGGEMVACEAPTNEAARRATALKSLIQTAVKPDSWQDQGGYGTVSDYNGLLVINHTGKTHKQIENVLKMLREAAGLDQAKTTKVSKR
ncbi:permease prefix domain 1-containing protein [Anatilimnocola sp. NA78]|uniref:permease prefix domain 1-containing protein n=1 Tax=Anatilimnocola sp. NA78 TaxID=3415683 RepID=UPI003CE5107C